ncbi:ESX secretion-associated protein EspG [Amycolatopsis pithecellobii]|uniref:ESX secretion-associated protein EspG n=1 Tax=Amycolatopsis pithecellobii TaxID=664692 RepID=A0A6N7ZCJ0_9PSEU|nr:ESX secretion-associated protein EspG [Amycolatopsis pithecellobii]MTD59483.1 hypothetical protein [Amycolatopsis pithecellobii]
MSDVTRTPTVFELVDEVVRPVAPVRRLSVRTYYDPDGDPELPMGPPVAGVVEEAERHTRWHAALGSLGLSRDGTLTPKGGVLFRAIRRGPVRGAVTGVLAGRLEPFRMHFFGDNQAGAILEYTDRQVRAGCTRRLPEQVARRLPAAEAGPGELVRIPADRLGRISSAGVAELRALAARPRLATMVFDLMIGGKIVAGYPRGAMVLFDTDVGRYLVCTTIGQDGRWSLYFAPATGEHVASWIRHHMQALREPVCG